MPVRVTRLYYYPVKSCRGVAADALDVTATGFANDRRWMVTDARGRFLTQRRFPSMALIDCAVDGGRLTLSAPGRAPLEVDSGGAPHPARVWGFDGDAEDCGDRAADWLGDYLGHACRLVFAGRSWRRPVDAAYDYRHAATPLLFADGFPFLLISQASLDGLNARLGAPLEMIRFRPNIVVAGCGPHAEDDWRGLRIGDVEFRAAGPCARCAIPQVDPATGVPGDEPAATLARYRQREDGDIYFGQNLIHRRAAGRARIAVGDELQSLAD